MASMEGQQDYSQYGSWQKVVAPTGQTYYKVPGTGYLYDPFLSKSKGRPVLFQDPTQAISDRDAAAKAAKEASSPMAQILPVAGMAAGQLGMDYVSGLIAGPKAVGIAPGGGVIMSDGTIKGATAIGQQVAAPATTAAGAFSSGVSGIGPVASGGEYAGALGGAPATTAAPGGMFSLGGIGSAGNLILPAAGAVGALDLFANKRSGGRGALQGAASGAAIGSFGGPPGAIAGAVIGGTLGYFGNFGDKDAYKTEWGRRKKLYDQGIITEAQLGPEPKSGKSKDQLIAEARANGGNITFASSRKESDLKPEDIAGYASVLEKAHQSGRSAIDVATEYLNAGAVREHHGTIDLDDSKLTGKKLAEKINERNLVTK